MFFYTVSGESKSGRGIQWNSSFGAVQCRHSEKPRFYRLKAESPGSPIRRYRAVARMQRSTANYRPTRVLHATVPSSSGPARKHTAQLEQSELKKSGVSSGFGVGFKKGDNAVTRRVFTSVGGKERKKASAAGAGRRPERNGEGLRRIGRTSCTFVQLRRRGPGAGGAEYEFTNSRPCDVYTDKVGLESILRAQYIPES